MSKSTEKKVDKMVQTLYAKAEKTEFECPHCKKMIPGGDFGELAKAVQLAVQWEGKKMGKDGGNDYNPNWAEEEEHGKTE
jgi:hypothetical protein